MKENLPPLSALIAFEAAGRLQSFTRAAAELHVTQAAVSRQIRLLEDHIGRPLFTRAHRAVELTNEGRDYLHTVVNALTHIGAATADLKTAARDPRLFAARISRHRPSPHVVCRRLVLRTVFEQISHVHGPSGP